MAIINFIKFQPEYMAMMSGDISVPAIRIVQRNFPYLSDGEEQTETELYITALPLKVLEERGDIDRRHPGNPEGYQREPNANRINNEMVKYLTGEIGSYPTSILVNVRDSVKYEPKERFNGMELGHLTIPASAKLIIIDGQHRVESLKQARRLIGKISENWAKDIEEYPLPITILKVDRMMEMVHFYIVNARQRSVPTDLAFELLREMVYRRTLPQNVAKSIRGLIKPSELWKAKAMEITNIINEDSRSVWRGRLQRVGEEREERHIAKAKSFAQSLQHIVKDRTFSNMDDRILAQLLIDYWNAIYELYPEAFVEPGQYTITTYTGLNAFHMLFPFVYSTCVTRKGNITMDVMREVLSHLKMDTPDHPDPEFRGGVGISKWEKTTSSLIFRSTNARDVRTLAENLRLKIELAMEASS